MVVQVYPIVLQVVLHFTLLAVEAAQMVQDNMVVQAEVV
jgi:hypothetical protein